MLSSIDYRILRMKTQCLVGGRAPHNYIPALGKASLEAPNYSAVPLLSTVTEFLNGERQVLVLMGDSGSGKTYFLKQFERDLWEQCQDTNGPIPILLSLSSIQKPLSDLMETVLKDKCCSPAEIRDFRNSGRQFILICDEYDEIPATGNIYNKNRFNKDGRWRVKLIIACRSYKLGYGSDDRFEPLPDNPYDRANLNLFQKVAMAPFTHTMIEEYVDKYVFQPSESDPQLSSRGGQGAPLLQSEAQGAQETQQTGEISRIWGVQDYMNALTDIPNLMELVENPYILSLILRLLPTFDVSTQGVSKSEVSLDALYTHIFDNWLEVGKRRLYSKDKNGAESEAFEEIIDLGFEMVCMEYLLDLTVAVFKHQKDVSFIEYKPNDPAKWKAKFFGTDPRSKLLLESVPLVRSGSSYRFFHPSLLDYLYSLVVFDRDGSGKGGHAKDLPGADDPSLDGSDLDNSGWSGRQSLLRTGTGTPLERGDESQRGHAPQGRNTVEGGQSVEQRQAHKQGQILEQSQELALGLEQEKVFGNDHNLCIISIAERPLAVQILADRVRNSPEFKEQLIKWVQESKSNKADDETLAANAMTILVRSGMRFNSADLRGIKIKGANLTGGHFDSADLRDSDFREVILHKCWLRGARLEGALLAGVKFGEFGERMVELEDTPITGGYSLDGKNYAVVFELGSIVIYDTTTWETTYFLEGFTSGITTVAFSPDGEQLTFGDMNGTLRRWMFNKTWRTPILCNDHTACISDLTYSPDGRHIATACQDGIARILDASSGHCVKGLSGHLGGVSCIAFSLDSNLLLSGGSDKTVRLWDVETGQLVYTLDGHEDAISKVLFSPDRRQIASSSFDKTVRTWSIATRHCEAIFRDHSERVTSIAYSHYGSQLVSCSEDNTVRMWNSLSGRAGAIFRDHTDHVVSVACSSNGKQLASCGIDKKLRVLDYWAGIPETTANGQINTASSGTFPYSTIKRHENDGDKTIQVTLLRPCWENGFVFDSVRDRVTNVTVSPDGAIVASASARVVNVRYKAAHTPSQRKLAGHAGYVKCIVISPDHQHIASGSIDKLAIVWDAYSGTRVSSLKGHDGTVTSIAFSSTGQQIVTASSDNTIRLWDVTTSEVLHIFKGKAGVDISSVAFSSNGKWIASGGEDGIVTIWDAVNYKETPHVNQLEGAVSCIVFSPDNIHIASGSDDGTVNIWNMDTKCIDRIIRHGGAVKCLAYSSTGENIASGGDDQCVKTWNAKTGAPDSTLDHSSSVLSLCYSIDDTRLWAGLANYKAYAWSDVSLVNRTDFASAAEFSDDCREVVWSPGGKDAQLCNADSGSPKWMLRGHAEDIERVSFSPVHNIIATASRDGTVKLWDSQTGECLVNLEGHTGGAAYIMFSPNGKQIATCGGMKMYLWNLSIAKSESPSMVGEQCTPLEAGWSSSGVDGQLNQQSAPRQRTEVLATILIVHGVNAVTVPVYSPDGSEISVSTADDVVVRYDTQSGESLTPLVGHSGIVTCIAYSLSGDMIATGGEDKTARIWSKENGKLKLQLSGHRKRITSIAFSPCGKRVATGSADTTIRLWSSIFSGPGTELASQGGSVLCVAYSPDGRFLVSGNENRIMCLWNPTMEYLLETVRDFVVGVKSIRWKTTGGGLCLLTGCDENPLRLWEVVEEGGQHKIQSRWGARVDVLAVSSARIGRDHGLGEDELTVLTQGGATFDVGE